MEGMECVLGSGGPKIKIEARKEIHENEIYEGDIRPDGMNHGRGTIRMLNNTTYVSYVGDWKNNMMNGKGTIEYHDN